MGGEPSKRSWQSRTVLVTGAGGFIGSTLVERLVREGARVRAFVRYNSRGDHGRLDDVADDVLAEVEVYAGDLQNPEAVHNAAAGCDVALHLGALIPIPYSYRHPREYLFANVDGTINVLEASRRAGVSRVVQVSSSEVYGTAQIVPIPETHPSRRSRRTRRQRWRPTSSRSRTGARSTCRWWWRARSTPSAHASRPAP